ncbi:hypothetical protein AGMMS49992_31430 [Clostridia bacterium]|nr:hypothetical protein AGMMS49992_31430 [Clostridia bacterium]
MALSNGEYLQLDDSVIQRAMTHVDASVMAPEEVSRRLSVDIFQKKRRGRLTVADIMKYWQLLIVIYRERECGKQERTHSRAELDIQAAKRLGLGVNTIHMVRYIARRATPELIRQMDCGEKSVKTAYKELSGTQSVQRVENTIAALSEETDTADISIPITYIRVCRPTDIRDESIVALALDIIDSGMKSPVKVMRLSSGDYLMLDGNKRYLAAKEISMAEVMAQVYDSGQARHVMDQVVSEHSLAGRVTVYDLYTLYKTLTAVYRENRRQECRDALARERVYKEVEFDVAAKMRVSRDRIAKIVNLVNHAPDETIRGVDSGKISLRAARMATMGLAENSKQTTDATNASPSRVVELEEKVRQEYYRANLAEAKVPFSEHVAAGINARYGTWREPAY